MKIKSLRNPILFSLFILVNCTFINSQDWLEIKNFFPSDGDGGDYTGNSVCIDDNIAVVGAYRTIHPTFSMETGSAYILYRNQGGPDAWGELTEILPPDRALYFGCSVSLDGNTLVVGAMYEGQSTDGIQYAGAAYIYERNQGDTDQWGLVTKLTAGDRSNDDCFGVSVSVSGDYIVVGANNEDHDAAGGTGLINSGSAYVFYRNQDGPNAWGQVKKIVASDRESYDEFGYSVSISGDNVIVGAHEDRDDGVTGCGTVYYFNRNQGSPNNWGQVKKYRPQPQYANAKFGSSVKMDGTTAIVGDWMSGEAYIFEQNYDGPNTWGLVKTLVPRSGEGLYFGYSVDISSNYAIVGASHDRYDQYGNQIDDWTGTATIYGKDIEGPDNWGEINKILAGDNDGSDVFGSAVSITNDFAIAGAPGKYKTDGQDGRAYVFKPYTQASNISFSSILDDRFTINWTPGSGDYRIVFVGNSWLDPHPEPRNNNPYMVDAVFPNGSNTWTNWDAVYKGSGSSVTVSGLTEGAEYQVMVCEYIGATMGTEKYANLAITGNPTTQTTYTDLTGVSINVAAGTMSSTTLLMEYSLNSTNGTDGSWYSCSAGSTTVNFDPGNVHVRGLNQPGNVRLVATIASPASAPAFTVNFTSEVTAQTIPSTIEYNFDNNFSTANNSGSGTQISVNPGTDIYLVSVHRLDEIKLISPFSLEPF
jgi:hypothetical protein